MFRKLCSLLLIPLVTAAMAPAQAPQAAPQTTFQANTELVLIPVLVRDKSGAHIPNLRAEDFVLQQDGKRQQISVFQEVHGNAQEVKRTFYGNKEFGNEGAGQQSGRLTVIAIDTINSAGIDQARLRQQLLAYFDSVADRGGAISLVALTPRGVKVINDFSSSPKMLAAAIRRMSALPTMAQSNSGVSPTPNLSSTLGLGAAARAGGEAEASAIDAWARSLDQFSSQMQMDTISRQMQNDSRRQFTLDAMSSLAKALAGYPGRKTLIWATVGMPFTDDIFSGQQMASTRGATRGLPSDPYATNPQPAPTGGSSGAGATGGSGSSGSGGTGSSGSGGTGSGGATGGAGARVTPPSSQPSSLGASPFDSAASDVFSSQMDVGRVSQSIRAYEAAWQELNDANVAVYPVDIRGVTVGTGDFASAESQNSQTAKDRTQGRYNYQDLQSSMTNMASNTGGRACTGRNQFSSCFVEAADDSGTYYMLGYYLDREHTKPGWHKLKVKTEQKNASLRTRTGFSVPDVKNEKADQRKNEILAALRTPVPFAAVPFRGEWLDSIQAGDKRSTPFLLKLQPGAFRLDETDKYHINLDVIAVASRPDGTSAGQISKAIDLRPNPAALVQIQSQGIMFKDKMDLPPGDYSVRFIVRDNNTGRIGSATSELKVN